MTELFIEVSGSGSPVVLLHGMAASGRYWGELQSKLAKQHLVYAVDLLGFGRSPKPSIEYSYEAHIDAIKASLEQQQLKSFILVGHSMGALLALRFAAQYPHLVRQVVLIGCPIYRDATEARESITAGRRLLRLAYYGLSSRVLCTIWCKLLRPVSKHVAPFYLPHLTPPIARDSVLHTWQSYSSSMEQIIEHQTVLADLRRCKLPVQLVYGADDQPARPDRMGSTKGLNHVTVTKLPGDHQVVLQHPKQLAHLINSIA